MATFLRDIARTSNEVVDGLGVAYTWRQSYVAAEIGPKTAGE